MLSLTFPHSLLKVYNPVVKVYLWAGKKPAFNWSKEYATEDSGGSASSKVDWYHDTFSVSQLGKIKNSPKQRPSWVKTEDGLVAPASLKAFSHSDGKTGAL